MSWESTALATLWSSQYNLRPLGQRNTTEVFLQLVARQTHASPLTPLTNEKEFSEFGLVLKKMTVLNSLID